MQFNPEKLDDYMEKPDYYPNVSFKLPTYAPFLPFFKTLPDVRVLWCVRDPRDVVASMVRLHLLFDQSSTVSWAAHPLGSHREIVQCFPVLPSDIRQKLVEYVKKYVKIDMTHPAERTPEDLIYTAALCWRIKNELLGLYEKNGISHMVVQYETLVSSPKKEISQILEYLDLPWHENVLKHHLLHFGAVVGDTDSGRPIDPRNIGKWRKELSSKDNLMIREICGWLARKFGYKL